MNLTLEEAIVRLKEQAENAGDMDLANCLKVVAIMKNEGLLEAFYENIAGIALQLFRYKEAKDIVDNWLK